MANRLRHETSPYLLQHAHNPVEWQPWDEEALTTAREQDRPILLSIGYSACHWCHVMERESFEDEFIAALMNELFVCIKVDREERPDLDRVYQLAHQMLTRRPGGWPLTVVLTPRGHAPFFAGTYFPPEPRMGMPGFADVLRQVAEHYRRNRSRMESHDDAMVEALAQVNPRVSLKVNPNPNVKPGAAHRGIDGGAVLPPSGLGDAREALAQQYDARYGGFGDAPKFPHPTQIELLLWRWRNSRDTERPDPAALGMAVTTLRRMADGGLFDQLAGGFYRYSVDQQWSVPHFEKMLYDNAQLLPLYADAFLAGGDERLREAALMTGEWVMAEMQGGEDGPGGYYSTLDADSEGEEGKYYTWTTAELESLLSDREWLLVRQRFGLAGRPNFEGKWHLNVAGSGTGDGGNAGEAELLESARLKLLATRARRVRPGCDDKTLTAWNGLMIKGMARAGVVLGRPDFIDSARRAFDFLRGTVWREGRLLATTRNGRSHLPGYLDDYAMLADGAFELCQATWRDGDLAFVIELTEAMLAHFEDPEEGGFFFTADDHETLLLRPKPGPDDAIPSGNGVAASLLVRLGHLLGEPRYLEAAEQTFSLFGSELQSQPAAYGSLTLALEALRKPAPVIVIRGPAPSLPQWQTRLAEHYTPGQVVLAIPDDAPNLPGLLAKRRPSGGMETIAYLCRGTHCRLPISGLAHLVEELSAASP